MPVLYIDAPPGIRPEAKRKLMEKITAAVDDSPIIVRTAEDRLTSRCAGLPRLKE